MTGQGLGSPPSWAADSLRLRVRWSELGAELELGPAARPAAEGWLAAWSALMDAREVNALDGAEQVDTSKLLAQLRAALAQCEKHRGSAAVSVEAAPELSFAEQVEAALPS